MQNSESDLAGVLKFLRNGVVPLVFSSTDHRMGRER